MSWYDILKNQITQGKQGVLTSDSPLPKKKKPDDNRCRNILRQWNANAFKIQSKIWNAIQDWRASSHRIDNNEREEIIRARSYPDIYFMPRGITESCLRQFLKRLLVRQ